MAAEPLVSGCSDLILEHTSHAAAGSDSSSLFLALGRQAKKKRRELAVSPALIHLPGEESRAGIPEPEKRVVALGCATGRSGAAVAWCLCGAQPKG